MTRLQIKNWLIFWLLSYSSDLCISLNNFQQELFGSGEFSIQDKKDIATSKHQSSSTEDLINLFEAEVEAVKFINKIRVQISDEDAKKQIIDEYLHMIDYDMETESKEYVYHPINAFHLLKRTAKWIPKIKKIIPGFEFKFNLPQMSDIYVGAVLGLADIHEHYNMNTLDLANGTIKDWNTGKIYKSNSHLTSEELVKIANEAKNILYLDGVVNWLDAALKKAKEENQGSKYCSSIKKAIKKAKHEHDTEFKDFNLATFENKKNDSHILKLNEIQYYPDANSQALEDTRNKKINNFITKGLHGNLLRDKDTWTGNDLMVRMQFFYRRRIQKLCRNNFKRDAFVEKNLKCLWAHHNDPYVRLGPFKYEILHENPEIAYIHDFISLNESLNVREGAMGKMKTTPYTVGEYESGFSKGRTSKVMYMNEKLWPEAMVLARKIQQATRYHLFHEKYASENFQMMNYGIGGKISGHSDSQGQEIEISKPIEVTEDNTLTEHRTSSEDIQFGGVRFVTFMIYLTSVEAGGHTIFPQAGISVKPVMGSALFWYNIGAQNNFDSRSFHLGCPVLYGNKWIANKWVKFVPQFKNYPCLVDKKYFSTNLKKSKYKVCL